MRDDPDALPAPPIPLVRGPLEARAGLLGGMLPDPRIWSVGAVPRPGKPAHIRGPFYQKLAAEVGPSGAARASLAGLQRPHHFSATFEVEERARGGHRQRRGLRSPRHPGRRAGGHLPDRGVRRPRREGRGRDDLLATPRMSAHLRGRIARPGHRRRGRDGHDPASRPAPSRASRARFIDSDIGGGGSRSPRTDLGPGCLTASQKRRRGRPGGQLGGARAALLAMRLMTCGGGAARAARAGDDPRVAAPAIERPRGT